MSNELETPVVVDETSVEVPATPVEPPEQRYEYQPTDEHGRPIGAKQVIKYRTQDELVAGLTNQSVHQIRKMRDQERKLKLGITDEEIISDEAPRLSETLTFKPKTLSPEDRVRISRDLLDPERFDEASDELFTAKLGVSPVDLTSTISKLQFDNITQKAIAEANAFAAANPQYVICQENAEAITNWLMRHKLAPVRANFQRAFETLRDAGILIEQVPATPNFTTHVEAVTPVPESVVEPVIEAVVEEIPTAPVHPDAPKTQSRVPVALNRSNTEETGAAPASSGSDIVYEVLVDGNKRRFTGLAAVDAMPADEYRRRVMSDPTFTKRVEKLEQEKAARRRR